MYDKDRIASLAKALIESGNEGLVKEVRTFRNGGGVPGSAFGGGGRGTKNTELKQVDFSGIKTTNNRPYNTDYVSYIDASLADAGIPPMRRASILANIIEESGGDPFAEGPGGYYGLLQWSNERYPRTQETDVYKEIDNQVRNIIDTEQNATDRMSWTHGGPGSGYNSLKDAMAAYNGDVFEDVMRGYTLGYVRPAGGIDSYNNRLKVAQQLYDLEGFQDYKSGGKIHIKPENRGKFTALKKRTGHSASWFKAHGTPAQKKMAVFALNAKKWKHEDGGLLHRYDGESEPTGQMNFAYSLWRPDARQESIQVPYSSPGAVDASPIVVETPVSKRISNEPLLRVQKDTLLRSVPVQTDTYGVKTILAVPELESPSVDMNTVINVPSRNTDAYFAGKAEDLISDLYKFDPKGKSRDEIRERQQMMADEGFYMAQLNGKSKDEIKQIQTKLIKRGLLSAEKNHDGSYKEADGIVGNRTRDAWNRYNVDGIWGERSETASKAFARTARNNGNADWSEFYSAEGIDGCAAWVTRKYESVLGSVSKQNGVIGNAWNMPRNIVDAGGEMLFNIYDNRFDGVSSGSEIKSITDKILENEHIDISVLRPGDVVGIYYPASHGHWEDVIDNGTTFNTHVGIVTGYDNDGTPIIEHNMGGHNKKDRADKLKYGSKITCAARPHHESVGEYPWNIGESKYDFELPEWAEKLSSDEKKQNLKTYMDSMAGAAPVMQEIWTNADMDAVQKIAFGVLGRETGYMQNRESERTGIGAAKVKVENLFRKIVRKENPETKSSDISKFKLSTLNPRERTFLGIHTADDLEDPAKAGLASMFVLAKNYDYFVRYSKENPELGLTKQDIEDLTALSYNQGMNRLYTVGSTEIEGKRYKDTSKLDTLRSYAEDDEVYADFENSKFGRIAKEYPKFSNIMGILWNIASDTGVGTTSGSSYMNAARRAIENIREKRAQEQ